MRFRGTEPLIDIHANAKIQSTCICGKSKAKIVNDLPSAFPLARSFEREVDFAVVMCNNCGLMRRATFPFVSENDFVQYYEKEYPPTKKTYLEDDDLFGKFEKKNYDHDRMLANTRCDMYGIRKGNTSRILDVGSGSGAFVDECRDRGADAYGCDIGRYAHSTSAEEFIYRKRLEDIYFPTDYFDIVTCHDAVEHVLDPVNMIKEMFRITRQGGMCIIDFPHFFSEEGSHHWKQEHLWYFDIKYIKKMVRSLGFNLSATTHPIPSKVVFYLEKPTQVRTKILLPPGIGDVYWTIVKLRAFLEREKLSLPDVYVVCNKDPFNGQNRSFPFLEMIPFIHSTGKAFHNNRDPKLTKIWKDAYSRKGETVFRGVHDTDYFISYNGNLSHGMSMDDVDPDLQCEWYPPMFVSLEQQKFEQKCKTDFGNYAVFYYPCYGTYGHWTNEFSIEEIIKFINGFIAITGLTPVLAGAEWDKKKDPKQDLMVDNVHNIIDMRGKTSVEQLFGMLKGAEIVIGHPSGLTIMSVILRSTTLMVWNDYYGEVCVKNCLPPDSWNKTYFAVNTKELTVDNFIEKAVSLVNPEKVIPVEDICVPESEPIVIEPEIIVEDKEVTNEVAVVCVYKTGGDFKFDHVLRLSNMLSRNITVPFVFNCLTDDTRLSTNGKVENIIKLKDGLIKWWSKVELFRKDLINAKQIIYFDLDTIILKNIDDLIMANFDFAALQPWNAKNRNNGLFASGMMSWCNGDYNFIYDEFDNNIRNFPIGDQEYVSNILKNHGKQYTPLQTHIPGIYSFKRNCRRHLPSDARIVCFHGKPRPWEVSLSWVKENYK